MSCPVSGTPLPPPTPSRAPDDPSVTPLPITSSSSSDGLPPVGLSEPLCPRALPPRSDAFSPRRLGPVPSEGPGGSRNCPPYFQRNIVRRTCGVGEDSRFTLHESWFRDRVGTGVPGRCSDASWKASGSSYTDTPLDVAGAQEGGERPVPSTLGGSTARTGDGSPVTPTHGSEGTDSL